MILGKGLFAGSLTQTTEIFEPNISDSKNHELDTLPFNNSIAETINKIDISLFGKYYVLDFFKPVNGKCSHGQLVLDVIYRTLHKFGAERLMSNIIPIELDFFSDKQAAIKEIKKYTQSFGQNIIKMSEYAISTLIDLKKTEGKSVIPLLFLQSVYGNLLSDTNTSIISSSFYIQFDGYRVIPPTYHTNSTIPLVSAVDNIPQYIEDVETKEPYCSFRDVGDKYGVILVGGEEEKGKCFGMRSKNGTGVTCIGIGSYYFECLGKTQKGTSFATPYIATLLYLAKGYWKSNHQNLSAMEAKNRLIKSTEIDSNYIGLYASGGIPTFEKLILQKGAFATTVDGINIKIEEAVGNSYIEINKSIGIPDRYIFRKDSAGFSGIKKIKGTIYVYIEHFKRWIGVPNKDLILFFDFPKLNIKYNAEEFFNKFKEAEILWKNYYYFQLFY